MVLSRRKRKEKHVGVKVMPVFHIMSQSTTSTVSLQLHDRDTGSADVQIAILSGRISHLTDHLTANKKDVSSRRGLMRMVARRRKLLDYLARTNQDRYQKVLATLGLRR